MECSNCGKLNQTITILERKNDNLIQGHDRLTKTNEQLRKEIKLYQKDQK